MNIKYSQVAAIFAIIIGFAVIGASLFREPFEFLIALALAGVGIICTGIVQLAQTQNNKKDEEKHRQIIEKLEKIEAELDRQGKEQPKGTGVVIADVLASGLKYYAQHMSGPKEEEEHD